VQTARLLDRIGKGIPGAAFGPCSPSIRWGPLLAVGFMLLWQNSFWAVFWVIVIPGALAALLLAVGVQKPPPHTVTMRTNPTKRTNLKRLGTEYWRVMVIGTAFTLARPSEAFLSLRAAKWYCHRAGALADGGNECGLCGLGLSLWQIV
jgi:hypothetical protein